MAASRFLSLLRRRRTIPNPSLLHRRPFSSPSAPPPPSPVGPGSSPPKAPSLSARLSFVFDQLDALDRSRSRSADLSARDAALRRIQSWRRPPPPDQHPPPPPPSPAPSNDVEPKSAATAGDQQQEEDAAAVVERMSVAEVLRREVELVHPWPEWIELMERLAQQRYFDLGPADEESHLAAAVPMDLSEVSEEAGFDFSRDWTTVKNACMNFGRDRFDILKPLPRKDLQVLVGHGCPSMDPKVVRRMLRRAMVILMERYAAVNEVKKAVKTFDAMEQFKLEADQTVFYSLLRALCKSKNIEDAEELLLTRKKFFPLTAEGFNIVLDGWCNIFTDVAEVKRVWREMSSCCITPDGTSYTLMVCCFSKVGNLFDTLRFYDEMKKRGWTPGIGVYNSLAYVLTRENCMKDAKNVLSKIADEGLQPDVETYNSIIVPLCESCKLDEARKIMEDMIMKGIVPTISTYHAFLKQEGIDETLQLLKKMKEDCGGPNSDTFLMLIDKFIQLNESGNALRVWNEMKRYDIRPAYEHYMAVIQGLVKHGCIPRALEYYDEMKLNGFASDPILDKEFKTFLLANRDHWRGAGKYNLIPHRVKHFTRRTRMP